ncbi:MAG TPA: M28 family peptidase [Hyphomicrobium sp.]
MRKTVILWGAGLLLVFAALAAAAAWYMLALPGESYSGPAPRTTLTEVQLAWRLQRHIAAIATRPHNVAHYDELEKAASYIEAELASLGYEAQRQVFETDGRSVRNIEAVLPAASADGANSSLIVGAHYDSFGNAPGANDNGTGAAAVLELARLLKDAVSDDTTLRFVLFVNEEPPYDRTADMGSWRYAQSLKERGERISGMLSLETIGCFFDKPGTQKYPAPFGLVFPSTANFVAFVALPGSRSFLHEVVARFRRFTQFPTIGGTGPDQIPGLGWSDHWSFSQFGFPGVMVTDTALFRYAHYHKPTDTPDKVDYNKLARITLGLEQTIRDLVR